MVPEPGRALQAEATIEGLDPVGQAAMPLEYETIWTGPAMVADANGEDVRRLRRGENGAVAFSPDGRRMAFARSAPSDRVEITRTDGTPIRTLPVGATQFVFPIRLTWTRIRQR